MLHSAKGAGKMITNGEEKKLGKVVMSYFEVQEFCWEGRNTIKNISQDEVGTCHLQRLQSSANIQHN
jgi:hypothetical protein